MSLARIPERQRTACPPKLTPRYHSENQCTACPPTVSSISYHQRGLICYARLTCQRGSHVYWRRDIIRNVSARPARFHWTPIFFGTPAHGLPAYSVVPSRVCRIVPFETTPLLETSVIFLVSDLLKRHTHQILFASRSFVCGCESCLTSVLIQAEDLAFSHHGT